MKATGSKVRTLLQPYGVNKGDCISSVDHYGQCSDRLLFSEYFKKLNLTTAADSNLYLEVDSTKISEHNFELNSEGSKEEDFEMSNSFEN